MLGGAFGRYVLAAGAVGEFLRSPSVTDHLLVGLTGGVDPPPSLREGVGGG